MLAAAWKADLWTWCRCSELLSLTSFAQSHGCRQQDFSQIPSVLSIAASHGAVELDAIFSGCGQQSATVAIHACTIDLQWRACLKRPGWGALEAAPKSKG